MKHQERKSLVVGPMIIVCLSLVTLWGCGGGGGGSDGKPCDLCPPPASAQFVYTANGGSDNVSGFAGDASTGALSLVSGAPFAAGDINENVPGVLTADAAGKFIFAGNANSKNISVFSINRATGVLTEVAGSPFASGASAAVRVHPSGKFLYAANFDQGSISVFGIDAATGALSAIAGSPFALDGLVMSLALHTSGNFAYATFAGSDGLLGIAVFTINTQTGALTRVPHPSLELQAGNLTMDPTGKFLYSARNKLFLTFSAGGGSTGIWSLAINSTTGALTAGDAAAVAADPAEVAIDPSGKFLYDADEQTGTVGLFTIDRNTGVLSHVSDNSTGNQPFSVAVGGAGKFLYVANAGSNNISAFSIAGNSGALTAIPGSPYSTGTTPRAVIAISPR